jgi:lactate permease
MSFILALAPIVIILILMVGLRWGAARAGAAGYLSALLIAYFAFGADPELLAYAHGKAWFLAVDVLLIIWAAFLLYRVTDEAGAIKTISDSLPHLTPDKGMQALLIGWVFATFLQGVGGFGVPVAVISPILVGLGFTPLAAVVLPSIGHGWAVTFGSLGSSFAALMAATGMTAEQLAAPSAIFLGIAGITTGLIVSHASGGWGTLRRIMLPALALGILMAGVQYLVVTNGFWYIGAFIAGIFGLVFGIPIAMRTRNGERVDGSIDLRELLLATSGYLLLIVITLFIQLIPPVKDVLGIIRIQFQFPETVTALGYTTPAGAGRELVLFRHTGFILFYASILSFLVYRAAGRYEQGAVRSIISGTLRRVISSSVSIASMVTMAVIMQHAGMTDTIARGLASSVGALYPIVAPWIGALGAFMTGSNTNSNVVFGALQKRTAELLAYSVPIILAAQTAGAALGSVMAPTKVVVGASTAGMAGREGDVMRKLLLYVGLLILLVSLVTLIAVLISESLAPAQ